MKDRIRYVRKVDGGVAVSGRMPEWPVAEFGTDEPSVLFVCRNETIATEMAGLLLLDKKKVEGLNVVITVSDLYYIDLRDPYEEDNDEEDYYDEEDYDEE